MFASYEIGTSCPSLTAIKRYDLDKSADVLLMDHLIINRVEASSDPLKSKSFKLFSVSKVFLEKVSWNFPDGIICWWKVVKKKRN